MYTLNCPQARHGHLGALYESWKKCTKVYVPEPRTHGTPKPNDWSVLYLD